MYKLRTIKFYIQGLAIKSNRFGGMKCRLHMVSLTRVNSTKRKKEKLIFKFWTLQAGLSIPKITSFLVLRYEVDILTLNVWLWYQDTALPAVKNKGNITALIFYSLKKYACITISKRIQYIKHISIIIQGVIINNHTGCYLKSMDRYTGRCNKIDSVQQL